MKNTNEPKRVALFVGVDKCEDSASAIHPLAGAVADARALYEFFSNPKRKDQFDVAEFLENPTSNAILTKLYEMHKNLKLKAGDFFLFFFAGHGMMDVNGRQQLICGNSLLNGNILTNSFDPANVRENHKDLNVAIVLDTCRTPLELKRGGDTARMGDRRDIKYYGKLVDEHTSKSGSMCVLYSCDEGKTAGEVTKDGVSHGLFTLGLLDVLAKADYQHRACYFNQDLAIAIGKAMDGLSDRLSLDGAKGGQQPWIKASGTPPVFFLPNMAPLENRVLDLSQREVIPNDIAGDKSLCCGRSPTEGQHADGTERNSDARRKLMKKLVAAAAFLFVVAGGGGGGCRMFCLERNAKAFDSIRSHYAQGKFEEAVKPYDGMYEIPMLGVNRDRYFTPGFGERLKLLQQIGDAFRKIKDSEETLSKEASKLESASGIASNNHSKSYAWYQQVKDMQLIMRNLVVSISDQATNLFSKEGFELVRRGIETKDGLLDKLSSIKKELTDVRDRRRNNALDLLQTAHDYEKKQRWEECVFAADAALALDSSNEDASHLKTAAQEEIKKRDEPRVRLVALLNGVSKNATVVGYNGKTTEDNVFTFERDKLGKKVTFDVEYEDVDAYTRYVGRRVYTIEKGLHEFRIDLDYRDTLSKDRQRCGRCGALLEEHVYKCPKCKEVIKADKFINKEKSK